MSSPPPALEGLRIDRAGAPPPRARGWLVVVVILILLGAGTGLAWLQQPRAVLVHTALVQEAAGGADRTLLNASGYVTARREATISAKNTGKVVEVLVEEGMKVEEGQVLARLDATNVEAELEQSAAELASANSALNEISANLDLAVREQQRVEQLAANQFVSKSDVDHYQTDVRVLQARLGRQQADVTVADKTLAVWKQELDDTIIRAPFAGVVISKDAQPGEMISPISAGGGYTRTGICTDRGHGLARN